MPKQNGPVRLFDGPHQPYEPFWTVRDAAGSEPEIELYGYISEYSWYDDDVTPAKFRSDLERVGGGGPVTIRLNSGGGDVFAASVIRSILVDYPGQVTVRIDGLCASAATFVATAGDVVRMQDTAYWMIHDPSALAWGTIEEIKGILDLLKTVKNGIMDAYQARSNLEREKLSRMMTDETWLTAQEAKEYGFVDEVIGEKPKAKPSALQSAAITNALKEYRNLPEALMALLEAQPSAAESSDVARLRAETKLLMHYRED